MATKRNKLPTSTVLWRVSQAKKLYLEEVLHTSFFKACVCEYQKQEYLFVSVRDEQNEKELWELYKMTRNEQLLLEEIDKENKEDLYHLLTNETIAVKTTEVIHRGYNPYPAVSITLRKYRDTQYDELLFDIGVGNMRDIRNLTSHTLPL